MKRIFTAAIAVGAIALAGATPARAITFPALTTIYIASGASDHSPGVAGRATFVTCTNMSGLTASVRYQFRGGSGTLLAGGTLLLSNLATHSITTEGSVFLTQISLPTGAFFGGTVQILSTQSAVYCSAMLINATTVLDGGAEGIALHMVRFNPHPGTVE